MKKLLMFCYYFPPISDVGAIRSEHFSKYLPRFGWNPTVITVSNPMKGYCETKGDQLPGMPIVKAPSAFNPMPLIHLSNALYAATRRFLGLRESYAFFVWLTQLWIPDPFMFWIPGATRAAQKLPLNRFDAIYASCSPLSGAVAAAWIKKRSGLPLILDFRDPMSRRVLRGDETFSDLARYRIEKQLLQYCDELILVTEETRQRYLTAYPFLKGRVTVLRNGYHDFFKFQGSAHEGSRKQFRMIYSGNFYHGMVPSEPFFDALKHIVKEQLLPGDRIFFHYVGASSHWIKKLVQERDLTDYVRIDDPVPREQLRHHLKASNAVLLRNYTPCISTKLYEGIAMGKPLLATVESREVETIIKSFSPHSIVVSPTDIEGIVQAICALYRKWEAGVLIDTISTEFLEEYSWETRTKRLAEVLDTITCSNGRNQHV